MQIDIKINFSKIENIAFIIHDSVNLRAYITLAK